MSRHPQHPPLPAVQAVADKLFTTLERFLHVEAVSGIVLLPTFYLAEQLRSGALKPVLCKFKPQELAVYAVYPERRNLMPKVRAFVDFLATTFGPEPPWEQGWTLPD